MPALAKPCFLALPALLVLATFGGASDAAAAQSASRNPGGGGGSVVLEPVPTGASPRRTHRLVFACAAPGLVTFSDRPCGPVTELREIRIATTAPQPGATASTTPAAPAASPREAVQDNRAALAERKRADARKDQCRSLEEAVDALDQHMRAGYSAAEAARLWRRWREAKERLRAADC